MKTPRVYLSLSALILVVSFAASGTVYAQSLSTPTVSLDTPAVSPLNQDEPVVQQQTKVVAKKSSTLTKAQQAAKDAQLKKDALAKQLADEQKAIADLKQKIADKKAADAAAAQAAQVAQAAPVQAAPVTQAAPVAYSAPVSSGNCVTGYSSGDYYLDKIINYESTGNSCATNPGGCFGLLQACPGAPLRAACGGDPSCQIAWFQANKTGGRSWSEVWQHELDYGWW